MAILFRSSADFSVGGMAARLTVYFSNGRLRAELAPDAPVSSTVYTDALDVTVTYGGEEKRLYRNPFTKPVSAVFPAVDGLKNLTLTSPAEIVYDGTGSGSLTVSWKGDGTLEGAQLSVTRASGLRLQQNSRIEWSVSGVPDGYLAYTLGVWMWRAPTTGIEPVYTRSCLTDRKSADFVLEHSIDDLAVKNVVFYRIAVGLYRADGAASAGREDYELYLETDSPAFVCSGDNLYTIAPYDLRCSGIGRNRVVHLTWKTLETATEMKGFHMQYTYKNGIWEDVFWDVCPSLSYSFRIPENAERAAFRIKAYSSRSKYEQSEFLYSPWLEIGQSNVYVGHHGGVVPASELFVGTASASASVTVG